MPFNFIETNSQYHNGFEVNEYNNKFSLCEGNLGKDDKVWLKWVFPQDKEKQPRDKAIPMQIRLGTKEKAIERLKKVIEIIESYEESEPVELPLADDDIPF